MLDYKIPTRGNILDRDGHTIASQADAVALGVVPGDIKSNTEDTLVLCAFAVDGADAR